MRKSIFLFFAFLCILPILNAQSLTVASYNIRNQNQGDADAGNGWQQRCPVITQLIRFHDFDIFGAQEVLHGQLNDMLSELPDYSAIGVGRDDGKTKGEYSPIFYKTDKLLLVKSGQFWLSQTDDKPSVGWDAALPRICTWGKFQIKESGKQFWFLNLHMDHIGVKARLESSKLVVEKIKQICQGEPVILTGDFNVDQTNDGYKYITSSGILWDTYETADIRYALNGTFNAFDVNLKTDSRIDHIFVTQNFQPVRYGVLTDTYRGVVPDESAKDIKSGNFPKEVSLHKYIPRLPSDHFPVKVILNFEE